MNEIIVRYEFKKNGAFVGFANRIIHVKEECSDIKPHLYMKKTDELHGNIFWVDSISTPGTSQF